MMDADNPPYVAIPIFLTREFEHSVIYVNTNSGIKTPHDLVDRTIGEFAIYGHDMGYWPRGILTDEYNFHPEQNRWRIGGVLAPMAPFDFVPLQYPPEVDMTYRRGGRPGGAQGTFVRPRCERCARPAVVAPERRPRARGLGCRGRAASPAVRWRRYPADRGRAQAAAPRVG